ncbi:MAG: hypothetical protein A3H28_14195 [Acidobacteria bacterium RIFCSPLOWO2_02_FULL_61_28]|nr:MAG: hypothetical protein A3H28_14195 [Acidobacteria bacterium RIFCSPLOWO2_02_FULL_61_28]
MPFVTVKKKYQVVIPVAVRRKLRIEVGDLLEAKAARGKVTFVAKSAIDRELAEGLDDIKHGRFIGPFDNVADALKALREKTKKRK